MDEFKKTSERFIKLRIDKAAIEEELGLVNDELSITEKKLMLLMEEMNLGKYSIPGTGTIYQTERFYARTPKTPEAKSAFYDYLKSTGEYEALISVNSNTLNAWYKLKMDAAKGAGEFLEVPGITEIGTVKSLTLRKV